MAVCRDQRLEYEVDWVEEVNTAKEPLKGRITRNRRREPSTWETQRANHWSREKNSFHE